jgi:hypothetical protein
MEVVAWLTRASNSSIFEILELQLSEYKEWVEIYVNLIKKENS